LTTTIHRGLSYDLCFIRTIADQTPQHQIHQARQRQNQPQQLDDDSVDLKRGAEDDDGEARRKKARPAKRRDE
jgi:hypothetical protein